MAACCYSPYGSYLTTDLMVEQIPLLFQPTLSLNADPELPT